MTSSAADAEVGPPRRRPQRRRRAAIPSDQRWRPWLLLAPAFVVLATLFLYPFVRVILLSFQTFELRELNLLRDGSWADRWIGMQNWAGLANYRDVLDDRIVWTALANTIVFAAVNVALTVTFGTLVGLLLFRLGRRLRTFVSTCIMVAWALPAVTGTYVWVFLFDARRGPVIKVLDWIGVADPDTTNWFSDRWSFFTIATLNVVHHGFPFVAVTVLAGLMTIPSDVIESAAMDGAGAWQRFRYITAPMLKPVFAVVTILSTIWDFKVFAQLYLMPGGDGIKPKHLVLGTWSYVKAFGNHNFGMGSAIAVCLTVILLVVTVMYLRTMFREEEV